MKFRRSVVQLSSSDRTNLAGSPADHGWPWCLVNENALKATSKIPQKEANRKTLSSHYCDWTYGIILVFGSERTDPIRGEIERRSLETLWLRRWWSRKTVAKGECVIQKLKLRDRSQSEIRWISMIRLGLWKNSDPSVEENGANSRRA
jgi:hypothetical protein